MVYLIIIATMLYVALIMYHEEKELIIRKPVNPSLNGSHNLPKWLIDSDKR